MRARLILEHVAVSLSDGERRFSLEVPALEVLAGQVVGLTGASGTGKTLLLETLGLLRRPSTAGRFAQVSAQGETLDLTACWTGGRPGPAELRGQLFGFVPQSGGLLPFLSVRENVALAARISGRVDAAWCDELITRLALSDVARLRPGALSIGQRQRVAIARALAHRPAFVIADEPTAALDPDAARTAMGLLIDTATEQGAAVIVSSHDLALLARFPALTRVTLELTSPPGAAHAQSRLKMLEPAR